MEKNKTETTSCVKSSICGNLHKNKETLRALRQSYRVLGDFSGKYQADFKRFLFSLNILFPKFFPAGKKILDIGSGIGIMALALKNLGADVVGVDKFIFPDEPENFYTVANFEKLKRIWDENGIKVIKADINEENLPFPDGYFDIAVCDATIEHLDWSPKELFKDVRRVLKDNGLFLVTAPNQANLLRRLRFLFGLSPYWDIAEFFESGTDFRGHRREFTLGEVVKMLEWSSFKVVETKTKNVFFNSAKIFSKKFPSQLCVILSWPLPSMREMIYVLTRKT